MRFGKGIFLLTAFLLLLSGAVLVYISISDIYKLEKNKDYSLNEAKKNLQINQANLVQPVSHKEQKIEYVFEKGEAIGILEIPRLKAELPIIEGTNEDELEKGVGHYSDTVLPGQPDQILLSGHRDTVFRKLGELEMGDTFQVIMPYGTFKYEIANAQIVEADDTTVIKSTAPTETLTVSTCYPFSYIGDAPYRYVLTAYRTN